MLKNIYVTNMSLQSKFDLGKVLYHPVDFSLENNLETRFPIVPIIAENLPDGGETKVIIIRIVNDDTKDNLELLMEELGENGLGIPQENIVVLESDESADQKTEFKLLFRLIKELDPGAIAHYDITYGIKPASSLMIYASQFAEKLRDVQTGGLYYGMIPRQNGKSIPDAAQLYDMTYFLSLSNIINVLTELEFDDPEDMLYKILDM